MANEKKHHKNRKLSAEKEKEIYEKRLQGISPTEIAYKNGITARTVRRIVKRVKEKNNE